MKRAIESKIWNDPSFRKLSSNEKTIYLYLYTNDHSHVCGVYLLPTQIIFFETGVEENEVTEIMLTFAKMNIAYKSHTSQIVWVVDMYDQNSCGGSPKIISATTAQLEKLPPSIIKTAFMKFYNNVDFNFFEKRNIFSRNKHEKDGLFNNSQIDDNDVPNISYPTQCPNPYPISNPLYYLYSSYIISSNIIYQHSTMLECNTITPRTSIGFNNCNDSVTVINKYGEVECKRDTFSTSKIETPDKICNTPSKNVSRVEKLTPKNRRFAINNPIPINSKVDPISTDALKLCVFLSQKILERDKCAKVPRIFDTKSGWGKHAMHLLENDGRNPDEALNLLKWTQQHDFWDTVIINMKRFREKYSTLYQQWSKNNGSVTPTKFSHIGNGKARIGSSYDDAKGSKFGNK